MSDRPPYPVRKAARKALEMGCEDLDLMGRYLGNPTVGIEWCDRAEIDGNTGETRGLEPNKIWIANDLSPTEAAKTVFHELRHIGRLRANKIPQTKLSRADMEEEEEIAHGYEIYWWRKFRAEHSDRDWFPDADS